MELNGFEIEVYNQYNLKEGDKQSTCPKCSDSRKKSKDKCLSLDWDRGLGTCQHCGEVLQLHKYKRKDSKIEYTRPEQKEETQELPEGVVKYFSDRGISKKTLDELRVSSSKEFMPNRKDKVNVICYNYYMFGRLTNIQYRDAKKNFKMYKGAEKIFFNIDSTIGFDYVVITEGAEDCLSIHEAGKKSCVSVPNGATTKNNNLDYLDACIDFFKDKDRVYIATDNDEAGEALKRELIRRLGAEICYTPDFRDCKDANEFLLKYGKDALVEAIDKAPPVPLESVSTLKDNEDELLKFISEGFSRGYVTGMANFDKIFSTYTSQFIVVYGIPSSGKSDFADAMCVGYNNNYGWKVGYASPENKPTYLHIHKLIRKIWGGMPKKEDVGTDKWNEISDRVNSNFYFMEFDKWDIDSVLSKGAELVKRKGIRVLVIDPYNKVRDKSGRSSDINKYTLDYLEKIDVFCKKYDVLVLLVAHPTKMYKDRDSKKIDEPTMYNIKGGGEFYDASYHGILVHRDYELNTTKVKVGKVKFQNLGENNAECHFKWDAESGNYIPHDPYELEFEPAPSDNPFDSEDSPF